LLAKWLAAPTPTVPVPDNGPLEGLPGFLWRTAAIRDPSSEKLQAFIVRLRVYESESTGKPPVLTIDLLQHESLRAAGNAPTTAPAKSQRSAR
jgi:hypothetical protein